MIRAASRFALLCGCVLLAACKSTSSHKDNTAGPAPILRTSSRIYVATPFDASYKNKVAQGSGKQTAEAFGAALTRYTKSVYTGKTPESATDALDNARRYNADYLVYPTIVRWEDHATEWSGVRDQLELKVDLLDLSDGHLAFSREIRATGKWMTDGGDTPGDLLAQPVEQFVNTLFRHVETPSALW